MQVQDLITQKKFGTTWAMWVPGCYQLLDHDLHPDSPVAVLEGSYSEVNGTITIETGLFAGAIVKRFAENAPKDYLVPPFFWNMSDKSYLAYIKQEAANKGFELVKAHQHKEPRLAHEWLWDAKSSRTPEMAGYNAWVLEKLAMVNNLLKNAGEDKWIIRYWHMMRSCCPQPIHDQIDLVYQRFQATYVEPKAIGGVSIKDVDSSRGSYWDEST